MSWPTINTFIISCAPNKYLLVPSLMVSGGAAEQGADISAEVILQSHDKLASISMGPTGEVVIGSGGGGVRVPDEAVFSSLVTINGGIADGAEAVTQPDMDNSNRLSTTAYLDRLRAHPNGLATLDAAGKVPPSQIPGDSMQFMQTWNAGTHSYPAASMAGQYWVVDGTGDIPAGGTTYKSDDNLMWNGTTWVRIPGVQSNGTLSNWEGSTSIVHVGAVDALSLEVLSPGETKLHNTLTVYNAADVLKFASVSVDGTGKTLLSSTGGVVSLVSTSLQTNNDVDCGRALITHDLTHRATMQVDAGGDLSIGCDGTRVTFTKQPAYNAAMPTMSGDLVNKGYVDGLIYTGLSWKSSVISFFDFAGAPPGPSDKDRYISLTTVGSFTEDYIYMYDANISDWIEIVPVEGFATYVKEGALFSDQCVVYSGTPLEWVSIGNAVTHQSLIGAGVNTHTQIDQAFALSKNPTGFPNRTETYLDFDDGLRTFAIRKTGGSFRYYQNNIEHVKIVDETLPISNDSGLHYVYYDGDTLIETLIFSDDLIVTKVFVASLYWNADTQKCILLGDERHGCVMDPDTHLNLHTSIGSAYKSGMTPADFTIGDGSLALHSRFSISTGYFYDEDIKHTVAEKLRDVDMDVMHLANSAWTTTSKPGAYVSSDTLKYNVEIAGVWQLASIADGNYVCGHVIACNDGSFKGIVGQVEYALLADAVEGAKNEIAALYMVGMPMAEFVFVGTVIYQGDAAYAEKCRVVDISAGVHFQDFRRAKLTSVAGAVNNHSDLAGLLLDDHTQYVMVTGRTGNKPTITAASANQLTVGYDIANKATFNVTAAGVLEVAPSGGTFKITSAIDSSGITDGAAVVAGGLAVAKKAHIGDALTVHNIVDPTKTFAITVDAAGKVSMNASGDEVSFTSPDVVKMQTLNVLSTVDSSSISDGCATFAGGIAVAKKAHIGDALTVHNIADASKTFAITVDNAGKVSMNASGDEVSFASPDLIKMQTLNVLSTVDSTGLLDGCGVFSGGIAVAKKAHIGDALTVHNIVDSSKTFSITVDDAGKVSMNASGDEVSFASPDLIKVQTLNVLSTVDSTGISDGSGVFSGGVAVAKKAHIGDTLTVHNIVDPAKIFAITVDNAGKVSMNASGDEVSFASPDLIKMQTLNVLSTVDSTVISDGSAVFSGGIGVAKKANIGDVLTVHNIVDATKTFSVTVDNAGKVSLDASGDEVTFASPDVVKMQTLQVSGSTTISGTLYADTINNATQVGTPTLVVKNTLAGITLEPKTGFPIKLVGVPVYADNAAALTAGLTIGCLYRTGADPDYLAIVH